LAREGEVQNAEPGELVSSPGLLWLPDVVRRRALAGDELRYQYFATTGAAAP
jgi:hypothetical protein